MQGALGRMLTIGSDDATGVFTLNPCCALLQGVPIYVVTNNQTAFVNATGLGAITTLNTLLVKGMPYYESKAVTLNGLPSRRARWYFKPSRCTCFSSTRRAITTPAEFEMFFFSRPEAG